MRLSKITVIAMAGLFSTAFISTQAQADCNIELPYEQLVDCIVVEGASDQYNVVEEQQNDDISSNTTKQDRPKTNSRNLVSVK